MVWGFALELNFLKLTKYIGLTKVHIILYLSFVGQLRDWMRKSFLLRTVESDGQLLFTNYHFVIVTNIRHANVNYNISLDRFKEQTFSNTFQIIMLTGTIVLLSLLGATVALFIILKCIGCVTHLHLLWTMRGHPGQGKDTVKYKSSGMIGDLCYCLCWKLPLDI